MTRLLKLPPVMAPLMCPKLAAPELNVAVGAGRLVRLKTLVDSPRNWNFTCFATAYSNSAMPIAYDSYCSKAEYSTAFYDFSIS